MRKLMIMLLAGLFLIATGAVWAQDTHAAITQGDFAVLLASKMNSPAPSGGWTPPKAAKFLADLGLTPISGAWNLTAQLKEGNLAHIMRLLGVNVFSTSPDSIVTWGKAIATLSKYGDAMANYSPTSRTDDLTTTTHINTGIGGTMGGGLPPPPPASPPVP